ncbi:histidinol-phosphate phosphatase [Cyclonatronum proteinivorum]|uniref:Histidinol-phosphate phosphatase n=1 Tax=Cyclonatronum proteinivorum TaxID=1457365 RepID=A0A345UIZ7_9BACT|nr:inositol monophosphatase family protein [Cyclonatronum proteinivorum]AXJ00449.1 histidinol-phosphate phosphatase [Cyclonatronum proteinivorum]
MSYFVESLHEAAIKAAKIAGDITLNYFQKKIEVISKSDDSPVTVADRKAEEAMRAFIMETFPEHGIVGEEFGTYQEQAEVQWILDPIDGTVGFIHGIPLYTNLIGITVGGKPTVGVIHAPYMNELVAAAEGIPTHLNGVTTKVRSCSSLDKASMMTSDVQYFRTYGYRSSFEYLLDRVGTHRTYGDAYGHLMVATGRADIMLDPVLNLWDAAALLPVIEQAGGSFTDLSGTPQIDGGNGFSCAPELRQELLEIFKTHQ